MKSENQQYQEYQDILNGRISSGGAVNLLEDRDAEIHNLKAKKEIAENALHLIAKNANYIGAPLLTLKAINEMALDALTDIRREALE